MAKAGHNTKVVGTDLFGHNVEKNVMLRDKFIEPPFSVLDTKNGEWQKRKKAWLRLGIKSEEGREVQEIGMHSGNETREEWEARYGRKQQTYTSIFDPALCELMYRWFCPAGGRVIDPFAGGSVRGIVAGMLGFAYTGLELRLEQVKANRIQAEEIFGDNGHEVVWHPGDSDYTLDSMGKETEDFILSCPPYHDLEVYSDDPNDLSNMDYEKFLAKYMSIICKSVETLKENRFAAFVVGDIRDKNGFLKNFNGATKNCFKRAGAMLYNEIKLIQPYGTAMLRADRVFGSNKKVVKVHEDVLIFYKGDPKKIKEVFNESNS